LLAEQSVEDLSPCLRAALEEHPLRQQSDSFDLAWNSSFLWRLSDSGEDERSTTGGGLLFEGTWGGDLGLREQI
jgi:hypothetical protein